MKLTYMNAATFDAEILSRISIESKMYWGYSDEMIEIWRQDLEVTTEYIRKHQVIKVYAEESLIGFYAIVFDCANAEIDHLWLKPEYIGKKYGKAIFKNILETLANDGFNRVTLIAEPNAKGFYEKMGGKISGKFQGKIKDRILDIYEFEMR